MNAVGIGAASRSKRTDSVRLLLEAAGKTASARKKDVTTSSVVAVRQESSLAERVIELIEAARQKVATVANVAQVYTNYEIGRQIVEEEQGGKRRAEYGKKILIDLSQKLTARFGRGWSVDNLEKMRRFFLLYSQVEISATPLRKFGGNEKSAKGLRKSDEAESSSTIWALPEETRGKSQPVRSEALNRRPGSDSPAACATPARRL